MPSPKILIVDDEEETRKLIHDHLVNRIECTVLEAANGYEALEIFQKEKIDLMLLDLRMPGISGTDVIKKAKEISREVPIIVISGWEGASVYQHVEECGADEYIPKPFSLKVVKAKVEEKLKKAGKYSAKS